MSPEIDLTEWLTLPVVANRFGVSVRTLEREVGKGIWEPRMRRRPGKKAEAVLDPAQVEADPRNPKPHASLVRAEQTPAQNYDAPAADADFDNTDMVSGLVAILPALMDLIDERAASMQAKPEPAFVSIERASEVTGLTVGYLRRLMKAEKLEGVQDVTTKIRRAGLESIDPSNPAPASPRKRGKRAKRK